MPRPQLSVNINKYALLRNSRGHDTPSLLWAIDTVLAAGAHGITIHPRRDQRHIRYQDIVPVSEHLAEHHRGVELNIECENHPEVLAHVLAVRPAQCTLVPVRPGEVTSDHGYVFPDDLAELRPSIARLHDAGIRASLFVDCDPELVAGAAASGTDRVELYTGPYAWAWGTAAQDRQRDLAHRTAARAVEAGMEVNAGHDLDRFNLAGLAGMQGLREVSIGHAQVVRALEVGTTQSVQELLAALDLPA